MKDGHQSVSKLGDSSATVFEPQSYQVWNTGGLVFPWYVHCFQC